MVSFSPAGSPVGMGRSPRGRSLPGLAAEKGWRELPEKQKMSLSRSQHTPSELAAWTKKKQVLLPFLSLQLPCGSAGKASLGHKITYKNDRMSLHV